MSCRETVAVLRINRGTTDCWKDTWKYKTWLLYTASLDRSFARSNSDYKAIRSPFWYTVGINFLNRIVCETCLVSSVLPELTGHLFFLNSILQVLDFSKREGEWSGLRESTPVCLLNVRQRALLTVGSYIGKSIFGQREKTEQQICKEMLDEVQKSIFSRIPKK